MFELDDLDRRVIEVLKRDARISNREIARVLEVSEGTIRNRLRRLFEAKVLRLAALTGVEIAGINTLAFVRMRVKPSLASAAARRAASWEEVSFVGLSAGQYNVILLVMARSRARLSQLIHRKVALIDGVLHIDTREIVSNAKVRTDLVRIT